MTPEENWESYSLGRRLDAGGQVALFHASRADMAKEVVVLRVPRAVRDWPPWADPAIAKLLVHQNIVRLVDCQKYEESYWFATEQVDGTDLRTLLARGPLSFPDGLFVAIEVCRGLEHALRSTGLDGSRFAFTHGEIRPRAVLISRRGEVKLSGFAIGVLKPEYPHDDNSIREAWFYLAPEQLQGKQVEGDPRLDVYAMGAILYEMLIGERWNQADDLKGLMTLVQTERQPALATRRSRSPSDALERIVGRALAVDPSSRFESVAALLHELEALAQESAVAFEPKSLGERVAAFIA
jgi:serine/threonine protein kinase